jgi:hypothetical protein
VGGQHFFQGNRTAGTQTSFCLTTKHFFFSFVFETFNSQKSQSQSGHETFFERTGRGRDVRQPHFFLPQAHGTTETSGKNSCEIRISEVTCSTPTGVSLHAAQPQSSFARTGAAARLIGNSFPFKQPLHFMLPHPHT